MIQNRYEIWSASVSEEIALLHLEVASSFNPQFKKAESIFEANIITAAESVQEIERIMSSELEEISKLLS